MAQAKMLDITEEPLHFQIHQKPLRTQRIDHLYSYTTGAPAGICIERARLLTEAYKLNMAQPPILIRAKAVAHILEHMSLYILPGSLLVGNQASKPNYSPLFPEFAIDFLEKEIISGDPYFPDERPADRFEYDRSLSSEFMALFDYWRGNTHKDRVYANLPEEAILAQDKVDAVNIVNFMHGGCGHLTPPWPYLFENGLQAVINECEDKMSNLDEWKSPDIEKRRFYTAAKLSCESVIKYANRYAGLAEREAADCEDAARKTELLEIARQFAIQVEDNAQGISPGRFDRVLEPYYQSDKANGLLDADKAVELIENFFVILSTIERIRSWEDTAYFRGKPIFQNLTTGGIDPKTGADATSEVSYLVMDAIANTRTLQPSHYVRWHKNTPQAFKLKIAETIRLGTGFPAIANDELYIPAMMNRGYSYEDAADYCIEGCAEPGVAGMRGGRTGASWYCMAKVLETALYNGTDPRSGVTLHKNANGKDLSTFESYEEVWEAFIDQLKYYAKIHAIMDNTTDKLWEEYMEEPMTSIMGCTRTVMERGRSIKKGGAKYDFTGNETIGVANVGNSLYAIKKLIFDDKALSGAQLKHALETDFADMTTDPSGPVIQQMCLAVPKYGNDVDEVDMIVSDALEAICLELPKYTNTRHARGPIGGVFQASTTTVSSNTPFGMITGSLPDGRKKGTPLSDGQSPMRGTDVKGPTAAVRSVAKCKNIILSEGSLYNMKLLPQDLKD